MEPAIIVHGGAWNIPDDLVARKKEGIQAAAMAGHRVLKEGKSSMDAVCAAICALENDEWFNAGKGAVLTEDGKIEMDAFIMDGSSLKTGAVASIDCISNPILLARDVMDKTDHCILCDRGARKFAEQLGYTILDDPKALCITEDRLKYYLPEGMKYQKSVNCFFNSITNSKNLTDVAKQGITPAESLKQGNCHDTVGAVAIDRNGHIACGTSTGGIPMKMRGRVGDTPLIGCGGYANDAGGASSTGHGESILRTMLCREVIALLESGQSMQSASDQGVNRTLQKTGGRSGVIAIDKDGTIAHSFTSRRMAWAYIKKGELHYGIDPGEDIMVELCT